MVEGTIDWREKSRVLYWKFKVELQPHLQKK